MCDVHYLSNCGVRVQDPSLFLVVDAWSFVMSWYSPFDTALLLIFFLRWVGRRPTVVPVSSNACPSLQENDGDSHTVRSFDDTDSSCDESSVVATD